MTSILLSWLVSFSMAFSGQAVITFAAVRMLKSTHPVVIWAIAVIGCAGTAYVNAFDVPADLQSFWSAMNLCVSIITYIVFSALRPLRALFIVACIMLVTLLAELATVLATLYGFGVNVTSGPAYAFERPGAYLFLIILHAVVLGILLYFAFVLTRRMTAGEYENDLLRTLVFPISQSALLLTAMLVVRGLAAQDERVLAYGALVVVAVLGSYLLFYAAARKMRDQELAEARIDAARERSELIYMQTKEVIDESRRIAKVRHDYHNQVQTIELLCEQEETNRANRLVAELLEKIEQERVR